ncbi:hypothetical protein DFH28DRAFT_1125552 [Melampsora americana]|nr:hypothetical protein DFH28DRAFT_1125552 [Melampsora americana]
MIQAIKKAEELKKEKALKELEQAESRIPHAQLEHAGADKNQLDQMNTGGTEEAKVIELERKDDSDKLEGPEVESSGTDTGSRSSLSEEEQCNQTGVDETKGKKKKGKGKKIYTQEGLAGNDGELGMEKRKLYSSLVEKDQSGQNLLSNKTAKQTRHIPGTVSLTDRLVEAVEAADMDEIMRIRKEIDEFKQGAEKLEHEKKSSKKPKKGIGKKMKRKVNRKANKKNKKRKHFPSSSEDEYESSSSSQSDTEGSELTQSPESYNLEKEGIESTSSGTDLSGKEDKTSFQTINFAFKPLSGFDLPDLPAEWEKNFCRMKYYVPLSVFDSSYIDLYKSTSNSKGGKKWDGHLQSQEQVEHQMTYGQFILACDLEYRYAKERYKYVDHAKYVERHKEIVSSLARKHKCWMVALRYHLAIRAVTFRITNDTPYEKSKTRRKSRKRAEVVILPGGLQVEAADEANRDAQTAGDLKLKGNPYAPGQPKFGFDFLTGQEKESANRNKKMQSNDLQDKGKKRGN